MSSLNQDLLPARCYNLDDECIRRGELYRVVESHNRLVWRKIGTKELAMRRDMIASGRLQPIPLARPSRSLSPSSVVQPHIQSRPVHMMASGQIQPIHLALPVRSPSRSSIVQQHIQSRPVNENLDKWLLLFKCVICLLIIGLWLKCLANTESG